jgi:hypothetical protein
MVGGQALIRSLLDLAGVLQAGQPDEQQRQNIGEAVSESDLLEGDRVPEWVVQMLDQVRQRQATAGWVPFKLRGLDDSDVLDFLRELDQVLPVGVENNEESWLLTFPSVGMEAAISFEGPAYKVSQLGATWD